MKDKIKKFKELIEKSKNIVFFGGAGVSTSSGIKDFRGRNGLSKEKREIPIETLLSHTYYQNHPKEFYQFYREEMNFLNYEPNVIHFFLKKLENKNKLKAIITQNIDGLHEKVGSSNLYLLHGSIYQNYCENCNKKYSSNAIFESKKISLCSCGGKIRPNVVLYEEPLNQKIVEGAIEQIKKADLLLVAGTSLVVYPAAGLIRYLQKGKLVILNEDETPYDNIADLVLYEDLKEIFEYLEKNTRI